MKILFISLTDPADKRALSGTIYSIFTELKKKHEILWIGNFENSFFAKFRSNLIKLKYKLLGKSYPIINSPKFSMDYAKIMQRKIDKINFDLIIAPLSSSLIANLDFKKEPIIYLTDAVFASMPGFYIKNFPKSQLRAFNIIEELALQKSSSVLVSSKWCLKEIKRWYPAISSRKLTEFNFGPNLLRIPTKKDFDNILKRRMASSNLKLLFIGVDWQRKGGDFLMNIFEHIHEVFPSATMTIVGCNPNLDNCIVRDNINIIPFLDKNKISDFETLYQIWENTHFLILPSKADCTPIVFSEAAAFGVPVITSDVGGIPSVIEKGVNGFTFPLNASINTWINPIVQNWIEKDMYSKIAETSRAVYDQKLNWNNCFSIIENEIDRLKKEKF